MQDMLAAITAALRGRYEIDREIGRGGMAVVVRARDVRHERWVALKILRSDLSHTLGAERFLREIRLAAALQHPHILPLYDSGEAAGSLFYVMPYVEGESLRARLDREGQLPLDDALRFARNIAEALQYAHDHDIVHRDIKPENILLSGDHALVADFGIARAITAAGGLKLTETGMAVGTPAYMSPEQAASGAHVDGRADVYATGCVLYEMLAGVPPYVGPSHAVMSQHSQAAIPSVRNIRASVPPDIEDTIRRAMAKSPADRFPTASAFAAALPVTTTAHHRVAATRRSPIALVLGALAATIVLSVGAWFGATRWARARDTGPVSIAVAPIRTVGDASDAAMADGLTQEITSALTREPRMAPRPYATVAAVAAGTPEPLDLGRRLGVRYVLAATLRRERTQDLRMSTELIRVSDGTNVWSPQTLHGNDEDLSRMQDSIASQIVRELAGALAGAGVTRAARRAPNADAYKLYLQARNVNPMSVDGAKKSVELFTRAVALDSSFGDAWGWLGLAYTNWSQYSGESPADLVRHAEDAANHALAIDSTNAMAWQVRAQLTERLEWDFEGARTAWRRAIAYAPSSADIRHEYAEVMFTVNDQLDTALSEVRRAIALDPENSHFVTILGYFLESQGRYREADSLLQRALAVDSADWVAHLMRGRVALKSGNPAAAVAECQRALRMQGDANPFVLGSAGYCFGKAGDADGARKALMALEALARRQYVERSFFVWARLGVGDRQEAIAELEQAANAREYDFPFMMREAAPDLWTEPRYQQLLRRTGLNRYWKRPPRS